MNLLLEGSFIDSYGLMIALVIILVVMIVVSYIRNKKFKDQAMSLIDGLKVGDDVKTYSGLCGKIVAFGEVDGVKTAVIACDKLGYNGAFEIDINAIYSKTGVVENQVAVESTEVKPVEEKLTDNLDAVEEVKEEPKSETKKSKKKSK